MKKLLLTLSLLISAVLGFAQTTNYHENMELIDSIQTNNLNSSGLPGWNANTDYFHDGAQSYLGTYGTQDTAIATSDSIDLTGNTFVILKFWQICKIEFFDGGLIEVSADGGLTWTQLTSVQYQGTSNFPFQGNKFTEAAYPIWQPGATTIPLQTWWQEETFDISAIAGNQNNVRIRFVERDLNNNGLNGRYGWLLDEISVFAAPCELTLPGLVPAPPILSGTVYNNGPYTYNVNVGDNSGIASVLLATSVNGAAYTFTPMNNPVPGDSLWSLTPADTFAVGDTICYYFYAIDASSCSNVGTTNPVCFTVSDGAHLTYCDNFDSGNLWTDSTVSGSSWELGTPAFGQTTGALSPPNAWDVDLTNSYLGNTECYLISPIFDFSNAINTKMKFWINYNSEGSWDGTRMEYTTNGGNTWQVLGAQNEPNSTNWYNYNFINSSSLPAWSASSGGWVNPKRDMIEPDFVYNVNPVQFRFVFTADGIINYDGVSIDDFCLILPPPQDIGVTAIVLPNSIYPSGALGDVKLVIKNFGLNSASNFDVYYEYNGVQSAATNYPGSLASSATDTVICPQFTIIGGTSPFCAYTVLSGDGDQTNDTLCKSVSGIQQVSLTYCNDFDVNGGDWTPVPSPIGNTTWELGTPNFGLTNTAHSAPNCWDVNLNTGYDVNAETYLLSPIFDFSTACNARMLFWQNRNISAFNDGARLDISTNGNPWLVLGTTGDTLATNWYNTTNVFASGLEGWDGSSNGWLKSTYNLNSYNSAGLIQLRFAFNSTAFTSGDGISIDDFCIINPPAFDIGADAIINPTPIWGAGQVSDVNVQVRNFGCTPVTNFEVYYTVNGGTPVGPTTYTGAALGPNQTVIVSCPPFIVPSGNYDFCAYTVLAGDGDNSNDTSCAQLKGIPVVPVTYCNSFDTVGAGNDWTAIPSPVGITNWELGTPTFGLTNSSHSAPNCWDVNLNTGYDFGAETYLLSPIFDFNTACNARMEFWLNYNTQTFWDGGRIDININGLGWNTLGTVGDTLATNWYTQVSNFITNQPAWDGNSNGWNKSTYNMNQYSSVGLVQIRFAFNSSTFTTGDGMSIDDFCMINPPADDIGVDAIIEPTTNWGAGNPSNVTIQVRNFGCNPISNFDVYYTVNGGAPVGPVNYSGALIPASGTVAISCPTFIVPSGFYDFCAYTVLATDGDNTNDTLCEQHKGVPVLQLNYCNNFDAGNGFDFTPENLSPGSIWELGTPAFGVTSGAHSAPNAWDINLTTGYQPNANAQLLSPFFDMTTVYNSQLTFYRNHNCENNWDGTRVDYSSNSGAWNVLGYAGDPLGTNWYTNNSLISSGKPGWDGNSFGWIKSEYQMSAFDTSGLLQLQFVFTADASVQYDGVSIDDFCLRVPPPRDAGCNGILAPQGGLVVGGIYNPSFQIKNFGSGPIDTIAVAYSINGATPVTAYYYPNLSPNNGIAFTFTTGFAAPSGAFTLCMWTDLTADGDHYNDSCCITLIGVPTIIPTYIDNFDGVNNGWTTNSANLNSIWELGIPAFGSTSSSHSAPNCWDVNLANGYQSNANCELISPFFDFTNVVNAEVSFWINYNTETSWDGARLDYSTDGGVTFSTLGASGCVSCLNWYTNPSIFSTSKPAWEGNSSGWRFAKDSDLTILNGNSAPVVFKFVFNADGFLEVDGVSIDDFNLYKPITITSGTNDIHPLNNILIPGPQYIVGKYKNFGTTPLNNLLITLRIDNVDIVTDTLNPIPNGPLNYGKDALHTFSIPWNASPGLHLLCVYTSLPNGLIDLDNNDDTTCVYLTVFDSTSAYPYCNSFENPPQWVTLNSIDYTPVSSWQLGTPAKVNLIGAHSGSKSWITNLIGDYHDNDESSLFSPVFNVKANACYNLEFWQNFDMDLFNDGGSIEYSIDSGKTWTQFGSGGDLTNWMNATYIAAFGGPPPHSGWTGFSGGWLKSDHHFESTQNGTVIFRFRFAADQSTTADGWAIDDVCFKEISYPCVTAIGEVNDGDAFYLYQNMPNPASNLTDIKFNLPRSGKTVISITNVMGQVISKPVNGQVDAGKHSVVINATDFAPGVYYYSLKFEDKSITRRMIITK